MYEEIGYLLTEYTRYNIPIDILFVTTIANEIINQLELRDYIKSTLIISKLNPKSEVYGLYHNKHIDIYLANLLYRLKKKHPKYTPIQINMEILLTIIHESKHALHDKILATKEITGFEYDLLNAVKDAKDNQNKKLYRHYKNTHYLIPDERLAETDSYLDLLEVILKSNLSNKDELIKFYGQELIRLLHYGYTKYSNICQSEKFLKLFNPNVWSSADFYSENHQELLANIKQVYPLEERLRLGLPISQDELKQELYPVLTLKRLK